MGATPVRHREPEKPFRIGKLSDSPVRGILNESIEIHIEFTSRKGKVDLF
jgi:hypothetical protein